MPSRDAISRPAFSRCARVMHALQGAFKVFLKRGKRNVECGLASNDDVVVRGRGELAAERRQCRLQAPADAIADDGVADFLGDGEAEAGPGRLGVGSWYGPWLGFEHEGGRCAPRTAADRQELRARLQRHEGHGNHRIGYMSQRLGWRCEAPPAILSRQTLAALGATARQNLDTACGLHALAEAVAALANKAAGLISAFHVRTPLLAVQRTARPRGRNPAEAL